MRSVKRPRPQRAPLSLAAPLVTSLYKSTLDLERLVRFVFFVPMATAGENEAKKLKKEEEEEKKLHLLELLRLLPRPLVVPIRKLFRP